MARTEHICVKQIIPITNREFYSRGSVLLKNTRRKMLAAREDLVDKASEIARERGTLYDYVNETLQEAIRAKSLGLILKEIIDERWILEAAKDAGFTLVSERLWFDIVERVYQHWGKRWMKELWYETGKWYGRYYGDLDKFRDVMKKIMWDLSEFEISSENGTLIVRCISPKFSHSYSDLFSKFLEGALNVFGYDFIGGDVLKGVINLKFRESKGD